MMAGKNFTANFMKMTSSCPTRSFFSSSNVQMLNCAKNDDTEKVTIVQTEHTPISVPTEETPVYVKKSPPEPPEACCRSGCANCVWIQYAQDMLDYYKDGGEEALKMVERIDDKSLKSFLKMEIKANLMHKKP